MSDKTIVGPEYLSFIGELKSRIVASRLSAARAVNRDMILLYWDIGRGILEKQRALGWGESVVEMLAKDLQKEFPSVTSFSADNLWRMRQLFSTYTDPSFLGQLVPEMISRAKGKKISVRSVTETSFLMEKARELAAAVPWGHNLLILKRTDDPAARSYYLRASAQFGWSRNVLLNQMKARTYERAVEAKKINNFPLVLPEALAEQADEATKSSYNLEFLGVDRDVRERLLENSLIDRLQEFILELGYGFCFVGRQFRMSVNGNDYFIDLLFYHRFLKALVAVELKVGAFKPEFAGKMDFYLNLLNQRERGPGDNPSIGIILCAEKDDVVVEFSLKSKTNPIGVAEYQLTEKLPKELKGRLPTVRELRAVLRSEKSAIE